ncbi:glyceraldehyde-3-phosphate dehydrogenase [Acanthopleuribacter pedis]|uniref:Glyceraldehyde-3-phosphate dehydrogenase n=1 Tax=Acanthopleuribacter pedis TaxID=442870 RepID=A0A8J7U3I2_9BACT|nr:glyceraldehyde-3-phosphate dehydrogenase [Acanthopleuribacter pedis]MBO1320448.1 glyceraldehyde-3-phosphate dehydrogenase [Acanthopleuribacter pedis]
MVNEYHNELQNWVEQESLAIRAIAAIHKLWVEHSVEVLLFRRVLVHQGPLEILKSHQYARQISHTEMRISDTLPILEQLAEMPLCPSRLDLGRLTSEWLRTKREPNTLTSFLQEQLAEHLVPGKADFEPKDVVLYGFGRIGRILARLLVEQAGGGGALRLRAVVCRGKLNVAKRAALFLRDSVHGPFGGSLTVLEEQDAIIANGVYIKFISCDAPNLADYTVHGIKDALVIDNTGVWRDRDGLSLHLEAKGVDRVLLTAPAKGDVPNIVYGVNHREYGEGERVFSAASCTTNAITPVLKAVHEAFGINHVHVETVHSYTNDQNLLDNFHKKERRGRAAALNMVITETGAAKAVAKALPALENKVSGNAVRVPTANVSLAIMNLDLEQEVTREQVNDMLRHASLEGPLVAQIDFTNDDDVVSSDMVGNTHAAIVDSLATQTRGNRAVVYAWYDNEYGYSMQVTRVARIISGVERMRYY